MSDELVEITVDGQTLQVPKGAMLITATDAAGITVPRFCYHNKLSVAANCRMCLVEVEKMPKPVPACATPIMPGMVVHTQSELARSAQRGTMEFLLINHPLDCPICDQGGECELQDVAMGYGNDVSRYSETKRVVVDKYIGPLIATELTRCIQCTRCVRFGEEIAGMRELGMTGRGENMRISTFMAGAVESELSGNVVDLCPVGALTMRPSRFTARAWELQQHAGVAAHDCLGSNLWWHSRRGQVMRVVPRENEAINQVWLSDRDRYSYLGLSSDERLLRPQRKVDGQWREIDWPEALQLAASALRAAVDRDGPDAIAALVSPQASTEALYLSQLLMRGLGSGNIDHRLRQSDFSAQRDDPLMPWLGCSLPELGEADAVLVVGGNPRKEQPLLNLRLRESALAGGKISFLNTRAAAQTFDEHAQLSVNARDLYAELGAIARALDVPAPKGEHADSSSAETVQCIAASLREGQRVHLLLGSQLMRHPHYAAIRALAAQIAAAIDARLGYLPEAANSCGAWLAGALPHRGPAGRATDQIGQPAAELCVKPRATWLLLGIEPAHDVDNPRQIHDVLNQSGTVIGLHSWADDALRDVCDLLLPIAAVAEEAGTLVNAVGQWQTSEAAIAPPGEARPAWKVLRRLGEMLDIPGMTQQSLEEVRGELVGACRDLELDNRHPNGPVAPRALPSDGLYRAGDVPPYRGDALLRRAGALQQSADGDRGWLRLSPAEAARRGFSDGQRLVVKQGDAVAGLQLHIDDSIPEGCAWIPAGTQDGDHLGPLYGPVILEAE